MKQKLTRLLFVIITFNSSASTMPQEQRFLKVAESSANHSSTVG